MSEEMPRIVRLLLLCALLAAAAAGLAAPRALADPPPSCSDVENGLLVSSAHVNLYYWDDNDTGASAYLTETQAGALLATLERAYKNFAAAGFPAPRVNPVTQKLTFQVMDLTPWKWWSIACPS